MMRRMAFGLGVAVAACGGGAQNTQNPQPSSAEARPAPGASSTESDARQRPTADARTRFMRGCSKSPDLEAYCACGWDRAQALLSQQQLADAEGIDDSQREALSRDVLVHCASKMPEDTLRAASMHACMHGRPSFEPYCACTWTELRKGMSPSELATSGRDDAAMTKLREAGKGAAMACAPKLAELDVREEFIKACNDTTGVDAFCACAWKELRSRLDVVKLEASAFADSTEVRDAVRAMKTRCKPLAPK